MLTNSDLELSLSLLAHVDFATRARQHIHNTGSRAVNEIGDFKTFGPVSVGQHIRFVHVFADGTSATGIHAF